MQLSDSFLPTGSFTLSHGLETLVQTGQIQSADDVQTFLKILLRNKVGVTDTVALIHAHRGIQNEDLEAVRDADRQLFIQTLIAKNRVTQRQSGRALLMVAGEIWADKRIIILQKDADQGRIYALHPAMFGAIAAASGLGERDAVLGFLHGLVTGILGAAVRLSVIGHRQAQQILRAMEPDIEAIWLTAVTMPLEQMWSCTPTIDIAQMRHAKLHQRLFAN